MPAERITKKTKERTRHPKSDAGLFLWDVIMLRGVMVPALAGIYIQQFCSYVPHKLSMIKIMHCSALYALLQCSSELDICGRFPRCFSILCGYDPAFTNMYD